MEVKHSAWSSLFSRSRILSFNVLCGDKLVMEAEGVEAEAEVVQAGVAGLLALFSSSVF